MVNVGKRIGGSDRGEKFANRLLCLGKRNWVRKGGEFLVCTNSRYLGIFSDLGHKKNPTDALENEGETLN